MPGQRDKTTRSVPWTLLLMPLLVIVFVYVISVEVTRFHGRRTAIPTQQTSGEWHPELREQAISYAIHVVRPHLSIADFPPLDDPSYWVQTPASEDGWYKVSGYLHKDREIDDHGFAVRFSVKDGVVDEVQTINIGEIQVGPTYVRPASCGDPIVSFAFGK